LVDFSQLKKSRSSSLETLNAKVAAISSNNDRSKDDRFWTPTEDEQGNGYAVIRFLPAPAGEDEPFVRIWDHGFKGPGGWYIENSLTTINLPDPLGEANSKLWASGLESDKEVARARKRRLHFVSNIYVVKDSGNPANEGKVFLWKYGKKIFEKVTDKMSPKFEDEEPVNPFDLWEGADFKLKIRKVEGYRNYDKSEFAGKSVLGKFDDEKLEAIWNQEHSLKAFLDVSNFKTYEELAKRLNKVLGLDTPSETREERKFEEKRETRSEARTIEPKKAKEEEAPWSSDSEDDDDIAFFRKLAADE
jgi:hypothetical protein